ncbi:biopolymer transporter ExbD [Deltaproteobacteria bacterium]|nr:biopolymer transporter ExbD [Deltaproteobacteria bacterium]
MAGTKLGGDDDGMTEINIVPLVDVILVVLIIFMVTTSYIVSPSIKVNLPDAATGDATAPSSLAITVAADRSLLLDGKLVEEPALRAAIRAARAANKDVVCLIAGDQDARHGDVTHIIDLVKQEGVAKFAINIDPAAMPSAAAGAVAP